MLATDATAVWLCHPLPAPLSLNFAQTMEACNGSDAHEILLSKENEDSPATGMQVDQVACCIKQMGLDIKVMPLVREQANAP